MSYDCNICIMQALHWSPLSSTPRSLQVRPASQRGGTLFAITDARQKVVELGLALTPVRGGLQSILLYYTDAEQASHSHKAAAFSVPDMTDQWTRFTVSTTKGYTVYVMWQIIEMRFYQAGTGPLLLSQ